MISVYHCHNFIKNCQSDIDVISFRLLICRYVRGDNFVINDSNDTLDRDLKKKL